MTLPAALQILEGVQPEQQMLPHQGLYLLLMPGLAQ